MQRIVIASFAAGAAMMIGGALGAVSHDVSGAARLDPNAEVMNPMVAGQAMLPGRTLMENLSASPDHTALAAAMHNAGLSGALGSNAVFTIFAPTNTAMAMVAASEAKDSQARDMGYLVVPGKYDSQKLLAAIGQGGGEARLKTLEGGVLVARMNGPTNITLMDEKGNVADIAVYDIYNKNGVMHVIDRMLRPSGDQLASN